MLHTRQCSRDNIQYSIFNIFATEHEIRLRIKTFNFYVELDQPNRLFVNYLRIVRPGCIVLDSQFFAKACCRDLTSEKLKVKLFNILIMF